MKIFSVLKFLLNFLCRHQFPPTPSRQSGQGGIPAWQRAQLQPSATPTSGQKTPQQNGLNPSSGSTNNSSTESSPTSASNGGALSSSLASGMNIENPAGVSSHTPGQQEPQIRANSGEEWHDAD
jgi:hypothetical protein